MDLSTLDLEMGSQYLEEVLQMPRRSQEIFFALLNNDLFNEMREGMDIIDTLQNGGNFIYGECKSPIEQIFAFAYDIVIANEGFPTCELLNIYPQEPIEANGKKYIADFLFRTDTLKHSYFKHPLKLVIECDGHDFHEKTKEQVKKNNVRNMDLQLSGYEVLHFSGSQIYKNPIQCAQDTYNYIVKKVGEFDIKIP